MNSPQKIWTTPDHISSAPAFSRESAQLFEGNAGAAQALSSPLRSLGPRSAAALQAHTQRQPCPQADTVHGRQAKRTSKGQRRAVQPAEAGHAEEDWHLQRPLVKSQQLSCPAHPAAHCRRGSPSASSASCLPDSPWSPPAWLPSSWLSAAGWQALLDCSPAAPGTGRLPLTSWPAGSAFERLCVLR